MNEGDIMTEKKETNISDETLPCDSEGTKNSEDDEILTEGNENLENEGVTLEEELLERLQAKEKECEEYLDMLRRTMADFDNYRKRAAKEKETIYDDGFADAIKQFLPVLDNFERAAAYNDNECSNIIEGLQMILKMFKDLLVRCGVEEISAEGQDFNPDFHNAVMHIEDDNYGENVVVEVMQKGYTYKDKVLRYSMVKVAN